MYVFVSLFPVVNVVWQLTSLSGRAAERSCVSNAG